MQVTPYLVPVGSIASSVTSRSEYLFASRVCFTDTFKTAAYLGYSIFVPTYILVFVIVLVTTNPRPIRRLLTLPRTLKAVVFVLIITYFSFAVVGIEILRGTRLYSENDLDGRLVVFINGSSSYTGPSHIGFTPLGCLILLGAALVPLLAVIYQNHPRIKPLSDVYSNFYNDKCRWWIAVNLWRRFALALLAVGISMAPIRDVHFVRQNTIMASILILTVLHLMFQPFRTNFANRFETVVMFNLCLLSGLSVATVGTVPYQVILVVAYWPFVAGLAILFYNHRLKLVYVRLKMRRMCRNLRSSEEGGNKQREDTELTLGDNTSVQ